MWKLYIFWTVVLVAQLGILFGSLSRGWLAAEQGPLLTSVAVLMLGCAGSLGAWLIRRNARLDRTRLDSLAFAIVMVVAHAGIFVAFFPVMIIFHQGALEAVVLVAGLIVPAVIPLSRQSASDA